MRTPSILAFVLSAACWPNQGSKEREPPAKNERVEEKDSDPVPDPVVAEPGQVVRRIAPQGRIEGEHSWWVRDFAVVGDEVFLVESRGRWMPGGFAFDRPNGDRLTRVALAGGEPETSSGPHFQIHGIEPERTAYFTTSGDGSTPLMELWRVHEAKGERVAGELPRGSGLWVVPGNAFAKGGFRVNLEGTTAARRIAPENTERMLGASPTRAYFLDMDRRIVSVDHEGGDLRVEVEREGTPLDFFMAQSGRIVWHRAGPDEPILLRDETSDPTAEPRAGCNMVPSGRQRVDLDGERILWLAAEEEAGTEDGERRHVAKLLSCSFADSGVVQLATVHSPDKFPVHHVAGDEVLVASGSGLWAVGPQ